MGKKVRKSKQKSQQGKNTERELEKSQALYIELFDNISSGVAIYEAVNDGQDFVFVDLNRAGERIEKVKKEDLLGKSVVDVFPGVKEFGLFDVFQRVWRTGKAEHHPVSVYKDDRIAGWRENYVFKCPSGEIVAIYDDLTQHKQFELARRMSEQCFRAIADYTYFWEVWVGPSGRVLWTNPAVKRVTGYTIKEVVAMRDYPIPLVYEEDRDRIERAFKSALKGSVGHEVEFRLVRKDGSVIWVDMSWKPICDDKGVSQGHRASIRDITDRKGAEQALGESEEKYRTLLKNIPQKIFYKDLDSVYVLCNESYAEDLKISPTEIRGKTDYDFFPVELADKYRLDDKRIMESGGVEEIEEEYIKNGQTLTVRTLKAPVKDENGNMIGIFGIFWDITEYKQAEEALRIAKDDWENIFESITDSVLILDKEHHILDANPAAIADLDMPKEEVIGKSCYELFHCTNHLPEGCPHKKLLNSGHSETADMEVEILGGTYHVTVAPVFDNNQKIVKTIHIARDITKRKQAEQARDRLNKELEDINEELRSILYVASHDLRSPLVNIQGFSDELSRCCEQIRLAIGGKKAHDDLDKQVWSALVEGIPEALGFITDSAGKMDKVLSGLLRLSRLGHSAINIEHLDMNKMIKKIVKNMEYQLKEAFVRVEIDALPPCSGDTLQIDQVFTNLIDNAVKYLSASRPGLIRVNGQVENGQCIYCVEDNGIGIAKNHQGKVFEAFYRLEPERCGGEGLGLTIVKRIMERLNGKVWMESEPEKGSKFFVSLPSG